MEIVNLEKIRSVSDNEAVFEAIRQAFIRLTTKRLQSSWQVTAVWPHWQILPYKVRKTVVRWSWQP
jgi:hypothetical protein